LLPIVLQAVLSVIVTCVLERERERERKKGRREREVNISISEFHSVEMFGFLLNIKS
jgi:hypothetical protein